MNIIIVNKCSMNVCHAILVSDANNVCICLCASVKLNSNEFYQELSAMYIYFCRGRNQTTMKRAARRKKKNRRKCMRWWGAGIHGILVCVRAYCNGGNCVDCLNTILFLARGQKCRKMCNLYLYIRQTYDRTYKWSRKVETKKEERKKEKQGPNWHERHDTKQHQLSHKKWKKKHWRYLNHERVCIGDKPRVSPELKCTTNAAWRFFFFISISWQNFFIFLFSSGIFSLFFYFHFEEKTSTFEVSVYTFIDL